MKKICVIFGGASSEHDISIITGMQLSKKIIKKYKIEKIYLGLDNKFYLATKINDLKYFSDKKKINLPEVFILNNKIYLKGLVNRKVAGIECVINCCHGGIGENGDLSGYFETLGIKYTSANSLASHIAMDKNLSKSLLREHIPVIDGVKVTKDRYDEMTKWIDGNLPDDLIVKPNSLGSSIGVKVCDKGNYKDQIQAIFEMNDDALVERRIVNIKEYNQACIKTEKGLLLSAIEEPIYKSDILSFSDKYESTSKSKGRDRIIPADISDELEEMINRMTEKIYTTLGMNGVVRIDYIFDVDSGEIYFNEVNTIPGSMAYYLYEPLGIDYISLIEILVANATKPKDFSYFDTKILNEKNI